MTREEAIKELREVVEFMRERGLIETDGGLLAALKMAIEALENIEEPFGSMGYNPHQE